MSIELHLETDHDVDSDFFLGGKPGSHFQPQHILFYRLRVTTNGKPKDWDYDFETCGLYDQDVNITQFIDSVQAGALPALSETADAPLEPSSFTVTDQCYVVLELVSDDSTMKYQSSATKAAIKTLQDHAQDYRRLTYVTPDGTSRMWSASNPPDPGNLIYIAVRNVRASGDDPYNLYLQTGTSEKIHRYRLEVHDPAIKNRGGTDSDVATALQAARQTIRRRRKWRRTNG